MKILVIGGGGREHAIIQKLKEDPRVERIFALPGNGGIAADAVCGSVSAVDIPAQVAFAKANAVDFVVVAPDDPLVLGAVDAFEAAGFLCFGPNKNAAVIEGSKVFSKNLMKKYRIPTAAYEVFEDLAAALDYVEACPLPAVVKADGLALGKGVLICETREDAREAVRSMLADGRFGESGSRVVIEEFLTGPEVSVLSFTDGKTVIPMVSSMDHKRALDGDQGLEACAREAVNRMQASDQDRSHEQVQDALRKNYEQHNSSVLRYRPELKLVFDAPEQPNVLRQRYCITLNWKGKDISLYEFIQALQAEIELTETLLEEQDRELFENILTETISLSLRGRIEESRKWTESMTALMSTLDTSMGLTFSLDWKAKKAEGGGELDTAQLVTLLNKDRALLSREDSQRVSSHFRIKVKKAREEAYTQGLSPNYADLIRTVLDYRNWYEFRLFYQREGEEKKELTDRVFNRFSGGEKAMAMYVPLFASVSAQYQKSEAPVTCPRLLALDEAFAGVDEKNIAAMFELVHRLDFDYIMNSQALWGCYACVDGLAIADLHRPANASVVTILRYRWNGQAREEAP